MEVRLAIDPTPHPPWQMPCGTRERRSGVPQFGGGCPDPGIDLEFIDLLSFIVPFNYTIVQKNKQELLADPTLADAILSPECSSSTAFHFDKHSEFLYLSNPNYETFAGLLYRRPSGTPWEEFWWFAFPFQFKVWLALLLTFVLLVSHGLLAQKTQRGSNKLWGLLEMTLGHGNSADSSDPRFLKWLVVLWQFCTFVLVTMYSSVLISFLIGNRYSLRFDSLQKLVDAVAEKRIKLYMPSFRKTGNVTDSESWARDFFFPSELQTKALQAFRVNPPLNLELFKAERGEAALLKSVLEENYVVFDFPDILHHLKGCSKELVVGELFRIEGISCYSLWRRDFSGLETVQRGLDAMAEMDVLSKIKLKYTRKHCNRTVSVQDGIRNSNPARLQVNLNHLQAPGTILLLGLAVALGAVIWERIHFILEKRKVFKNLEDAGRKLSKRLSDRHPKAPEQQDRPAVALERQPARRLPPITDRELK